MNEAPLLTIWLVGMFAIIGTVIVYLTQMVVYDTFAYDEVFVWQRKLPPEAGPKQ